MRARIRFIALATLVAACATLSSCPIAGAQCPSGGLGVPCPANSEIPCVIKLVGSTAGIADAPGRFTVVVRDFANNPVQGADVSVDLGSCFDTRIATPQPFPGITVTCNGSGAVVHGTTDASGQAVFRIAGGGKLTTPGSPGAGIGCATIAAGTMTLGNVTVSAFDLNGVGGVNPADLSLFLNDSFAYAASATYVGRSDYNCTNSINPADFSMLIATSIGFGSTSSAAQYCQ